MLSDGNARLASARQAGQTPRRAATTGRFLAEGAQAVTGGNSSARAPSTEIFATGEPRCERHPRTRVRRRPEASARSAPMRRRASLSETVSPQGLVAVCRFVSTSASRGCPGLGSPRLVVGLVEANDPGNAGTIVRGRRTPPVPTRWSSAGASVDVYNGKSRAGQRPAASSTCLISLSSVHRSRTVPRRPEPPDLQPCWPPPAPVPKLTSTNSYLDGSVAGFPRCGCSATRRRGLPVPRRSTWPTDLGVRVPDPRTGREPESLGRRRGCLSLRERARTTPLDQPGSTRLIGWTGCPIRPMAVGRIPRLDLRSHPRMSGANDRATTRSRVERAPA